jgi:hypothetical protein
MKTIHALFLGASLLLHGCGGIKSKAENPSGDERTYRDVTLHGTDPTTRDELEIVNLYFLLDPERKSREEYNARNNTLKVKDEVLRSWDQLDLSEKYDFAFRAFRWRYGSDEPTLMEKRNEIQERMIVASERRCFRYKRLLRKNQSELNFGLGAATTVTATLGALVPGVRAAQNFAGVAGLLSGIRAEYNDVFFSNLAVTVIVRGIEEGRIEALSKLRSIGQRKAYLEYPVQAAVNDAIAYDGMCSIIAGLDKAGDALVRANEPGLDAVNRTVVKAQLMRQLNGGDPAQLQQLVDAYGKAGIDVRTILPSFPGVVPGGQQLGGAFGPFSVPGNLAPLNIATEVKKAVEYAAADTTTTLIETIPAKWEDSEKTNIGDNVRTAVDDFKNSFSTDFDSNCVEKALKPELAKYSSLEVDRQSLKTQTGKDSELIAKLAEIEDQLQVLAKISEKMTWYKTAAKKELKLYGDKITKIWADKKDHEIKLDAIKSKLSLDAWNKEKVIPARRCS